MNWKTFAKRAGLGAALFLVLSAAKCDDQGASVTYALERLPDQYRECAERVVNLADYKTGDRILWKDAQRLIVDLKANNNELRRCNKSMIAWVDAQHAAFNKYYGR